MTSWRGRGPARARRARPTANSSPRRKRSSRRCGPVLRISAISNPSRVTSTPTSSMGCFARRIRSRRSRGCSTSIQSKISRTAWKTFSTGSASAVLRLTPQLMELIEESVTSLRLAAGARRGCGCPRVVRRGNCQPHESHRRRDTCTGYRIRRSRFTGPGPIAPAGTDRIRRAPAAREHPRAGATSPWSTPRSRSSRSRKVCRSSPTPSARPER